MKNWLSENYLALRHQTHQPDFKTVPDAFRSIVRAYQAEAGIDVDFAERDLKIDACLHQGELGLFIGFDFSAMEEFGEYACIVATNNRDEGNGEIVNAEGIKLHVDDATEQIALGLFNEKAAKFGQNLSEDEQLVIIWADSPGQDEQRKSHGIPGICVTGDAVIGVVKKGNFDSMDIYQLAERINQLCQAD